MAENKQYSELLQDDKKLLAELFSILSRRVKGNAYSQDGLYAANLRGLPIGLRAMAATYHLDVSLTLDDIGWHFLNFGEQGHVQETEAGLRHLGLTDLAEWFTEAHRILQPFLQAVRSGTVKAPGDEYHAWLEGTGNGNRMTALGRLARDRSKCCSEDTQGSAIFQSWVSYARSQPENVFEAFVADTEAADLT